MKTQHNRAITKGDQMRASGVRMTRAQIDAKLKTLPIERVEWLAMKSTNQDWQNAAVDRMIVLSQK